MSALFVRILLLLSAIALASSSSNEQESQNSNTSKGPSLSRSLSDTIKYSGQWETFDETPPHPLNNSNLNNSNSTSVVITPVLRRETVSHSDAKPKRQVKPSTGDRAEGNTVIGDGKGNAKPGRTSHANQNTANTKLGSGENLEAKERSQRSSAIVHHQNDSSSSSSNPGSLILHHSNPSDEESGWLFPNDPYRGPRRPAFPVTRKYILNFWDRRKVEMEYLAGEDDAKSKIQKHLGKAKRGEFKRPPVIALRTINPALTDSGILCIQDSAIEALQFCYPEYDIQPGGAFLPIKISHELSQISVILPHIVLNLEDKAHREFVRAKQDVIKCTYTNARVVYQMNEVKREEKKDLELYMADNEVGQVFYFHPFDSGKSVFLPIIRGNRGEHRTIPLPNAVERFIDLLVPKVSRHHYEKKARKLHRDPSYHETEVEVADATGNTKIALTIEGKLNAESYGDVISVRDIPAAATKKENEPNAGNQKAIQWRHS